MGGEMRETPFIVTGSNHRSNQFDYGIRAISESAKGERAYCVFANEIGIRH